MADNGDPIHYDPRVQAMEEMYFDLEVYCLLYGGPVSPLLGTTASPCD